MSDYDFLNDSRSITPPSSSYKPRSNKMPTRILSVIHQTHPRTPNNYAAGWVNGKRFTFPSYSRPSTDNLQVDVVELIKVDREGMEAIDEILTTLNHAGGTWTLAHVTVGGARGLAEATGCARSIVVVVERVDEDMV